MAGPPPQPIPPAGAADLPRFDAASRLAALAAYDVLDTAPEAHFDDVARLAALLGGTPAAGIGFVDARRCWLKAVHGANLGQVPRDRALCSHVVDGGEALAITDAAAEPRFAASPFVRDMGMRGYLGVPLRTPTGLVVGTVWVATDEPLRVADHVRWGLQALAQQVVELLEHRMRTRHLAALVQERDAERSRLTMQSTVLSMVADGAALPDTLGALAGMTEAQLDDARCAIVPAGVAPPALEGRQHFTLPLHDHRTQEVLATLLLAGEADPRPSERHWPAVSQAGDLARIAVVRSRHEAELARLAHCDDLTGLPNRRALLARLEQELRRSRGGGPAVGVLFCDLDRFKSINDSLGHSAGDAYLVAFADRLREVVGEGGFAARFGGDEFVVVLADVAGEGDLHRMADRIHGACAEPVTIGGREVVLSTSIGVALVDGTGDAEALLRDADGAMYRAKLRGGGQAQTADPAEYVAALARLDLVEDLRRALGSDELVVHYQPVVDLRTGAITRAEALVRWAHPGRGWVGPGDFLGVAADAGLAAVLDQHVLRATCRQLAAWQAAPGVVPAPVYVNLSAASLADPRLAATVRRVLETTGASPQLLGVEVTEAWARRRSRSPWSRSPPCGPSG
jgi:diguanylate cyclase (GGDEF)-like protein